MLNHAEQYVLTSINKAGGLDEFMQSQKAICDYLNQGYECEYSYASKNERLQQWLPDKGELFEIVLAVFTITLVYKSITYQAICGILANRLDTINGHINRVKTIAEVIAIISRSGLIDIKRTGSGSYIMVSTQYAIDNIPDPDKHEVLLNPPPKFTSNYHEDYGHRVLGGKVNQHDNDICLDHINRMNSIALSLNKPFLSKYEEAPTFALDTLAKRKQWEHFIRNSYRKYIEVAQKGNVFYLNHNVDKRGRTYAEGYYMNTQGTSFKKAIIQLANKEIVKC